MGFMIDFFRHMFSMPKPWVAWLVVLMLANLLPGALHFQSLEGRVVLGTFILAAMTLMALFHRGGFTRLLGLGHFYWIPMVAWLWMRFDGLPTEGGLRPMIAAVMIVNTLSLVIDVVDVVRWLRGERDPTVVLGGRGASH